VRRRWTRILTVALATMSTAWSCRSERSSTVIRVSVGPRLTMAATHLADEKGFFRDEGLELSFQEAQTPLEALTLVTGGGVEVALFSFVPGLPNAVLRGAHARIVAGRDETRSGCGDEGALYYRLARFPHGPEDANDWKGARVAVTSPNAAAEFHLDTLLGHLGIGRDAIHIVPLATEHAWAAAAAGSIDVFFGSGRPNLLSEGLPAGVGRSDLLERTLGPLQFSYIVYGQKFLDAEPSQATAFLRAYLRGVRAFRAGETPRFFDEYAARFRLDLTALKNECRTNIDPNGEARVDDLQRWISWAGQKGYLAGTVKAEDVINSRFQQAAIRDIGRVGP
jgi:NitT/TauT family transport system substrate-binding protein